MPKGVTTTSTDTVLTLCIACSAVPVRSVFISVNNFMMRSFQFGGGSEEQFCCRQTILHVIVDLNMIQCTMYTY